MDRTDKVEIVPFEDRYATEFKRLNIKWLNKYDLLELADLNNLHSTQQAIIDRGGWSLLALINGEVVGTCAILKTTSDTAEFSNLVFIHDTFEKKIGELLTIASINLAQQMKVKKIYLALNKKLKQTIRFCESFGFKHLSIPGTNRYRIDEICMELKMDKSLFKILCCNTKSADC